MDRRYSLMAALGVRNLAGYNMKVDEGLKNKTPSPVCCFRCGAIAEPSNPFTPVTPVTPSEAGG
jgi:DNA segregation ATPase FtsK/SpoIIIE-like protein